MKQLLALLHDGRLTVPKLQELYGMSAERLGSGTGAAQYGSSRTEQFARPQLNPNSFT
jgi:hypothetical protein